MMHIFIHFYIGHLEEQHGDNSYGKFKNMIIVEFVLTAGLAGIIWLEGQVSSQIAIIQGNTLYKNALASLGQNRLSWFQKQYSVKIANRFNHDYEQVFIILHMLLNIYKNLVILIATIYFISQSSGDLILMTLVITVIYMTVYFILRAVQRRVVDYFEDFKYQFVRVLEQSIDGAKLIQIHGAQKSVIQNSKKAYLQFASYKIAESYTSYGEEIFCDLVSLIIFSYVLNYGLQSKVEGNSKSIAEVATMLHLLVGVFDVLKVIVKDTVNFETFFRINLLPFVQIIKEKTPETIEVEELIERSRVEFRQEVLRSSAKKIQHPNEEKSVPKFSNTKSLTDNFSLPYSIHFNNVILHESKYHQPVFEVYPLNIQINQGEMVLFYESNEYLKNYLLYALTKNLPMFNNPEIMALERSKGEMTKKDKTLLIGGRDICCIEKAELQTIVQIMIDHDFYIQGTLEDNIAWKNVNYDSEEVNKLAQHFHLQRQLPSIKSQGLKARVIDPSKQLIKKMTLLRILSIRPKIIIIKDIESIIDDFFIVEELRRFLGKVTIIKIFSNIDEVFDVDRIIYTKNFMLIEDRLKQDALRNPFSMIGDELRKANINGLVYANQLSGTVLREKDRVSSNYKQK